MEYYIKHIVLSLIALLSVTGSPFAQEKAYVFLEKNVRLDTAIMISSNNIVYSPDVVSCSWNDCVYISDYYIASNDTLDVYKINTHTYELNRMRFCLSGMSTMAINDNYSGVNYIACNDSLLAVAVGRHLYIVPMSNPDHFSHVVMSNSYQCGKFNKHGDLVLYRYYYGNDVPTELSIFSIDKQSIVKTIHPYGGNMMVSYIGGTHLFDVEGGNIIFARPNEFCIDIYDLDLNKKDSITFAEGKTVIGEALWKEAQDLPRHEASRRIDLFSPLDYDFMLWTYLRGDDIVAVYRTKDSEDRYSLHTLVNVFKYGENSSWQRVLGDAIDRMWKGADEVITKSTVSVNWVGGNMVLLTGDKIISITTEGTIGSPVGMTMAQYEGASRVWLQSAGYRMQVNIFSFNY